MKEISIRAGTTAYNALVNSEARKARQIAAGMKASRIALVHSPHMATPAKSIAEPGDVLIECPDGEENKTLDSVQLLYSKFADAKLDRASVVIIVGGGTLGDLAGFACSTYMRGLRFIHVPTTLLAMADSSIGGKTGVDFLGKNMIGTFAQPCAVVMDFNLLKTLPKSQISNGLAEIAKCACIKDAAMFDFIMENADKLLALDEKALEHCISRAAAIKAEIVGTDEMEKLEATNSTTSRMLLNFGHTVGHALEKLSGYTLAHGQAVALGMVAEAKAGEKAGISEEGTSQKIAALLNALHLPVKTKLPDKKLVLNEMAADKKSVSGKIRIAGLKKIGEGTVIGNLPDSTILTGLEEVRE